MTRRHLPVLLLSVLVARPIAAQTVNWPVYGGSDDHTHFTTLSQISPANVRKLKVAWTYDTHDAFAGSEMQSNPIVVDGVLYATTPKLQVFALDAATRLKSGVSIRRMVAPPRHAFAIGAWSLRETASSSTTATDSTRSTG